MDSNQQQDPNTNEKHVDTNHVPQSDNIENPQDIPVSLCYCHCHEVGLGFAHKLDEQNNDACEIRSCSHCQPISQENSKELTFECVICKQQVLYKDRFDHRAQHDNEQSNGSVEGVHILNSESNIMSALVEEKTKHPGGRLSKYNEGMIQKAQGYLDKCLGKVDGKRRLPLIEELARICEVDSDTITNWANKKDEEGNLVNEEFFGLYKKIKNFQKEVLIQRGLTMKNPTFAIFLLKAQHDMIETEKRLLGADKNSEPPTFNVNVTNYGEVTPLQEVAKNA